MGGIGSLMQTVTKAFTTRRGREAVEGELTTEVFALDGHTVQATITIKVEPVKTAKAA
jgi:hypothetical protein